MKHEETKAAVSMQNIKAGMKIFLIKTSDILLSLKIETKSAAVLFSAFF